MFSGIIQCTATVLQSGERLRLQPQQDLGLGLGSSLAVNGACMTVVAIDSGVLSFDLSAESLRRTNLGLLQPGAVVNLEPALRLGASLDGHLVSGHVDTTATLSALKPEPEGRWLLRVAYPEQLGALIALKGSVCVDGISLTVSELSASHFGVHVVPYTWEHTNLCVSQVGAVVNLEVDLVARYLQRIYSVASAGG